MPDVYTKAPNFVALTIMLDLGEYQFKQLRLTTKYDETRLALLKAEAMKFVLALENVISFELGEVYQLQPPRDEELPDRACAKLEKFLKQFSHWEYNAFWGER